jgi:receptor protein-tyrosine kinase
VWSALRAKWAYAFLAMLLGGLAGFGVSYLSGPRYTTSMQFFVSTTDSGSTSDALQSSQFAQQRVSSYAGLLTGKELARRVVDRLDLRMAPEQLAGEISASTVTGTVLINVSVTDPSAGRATQIADALGTEFPDLVSDLESTGSSRSGTPVNVRLTDRPGPAVAPFPPLSVRDTVLGAVLGLLAGAALALVRVLLDRSVREREDAERLAGAPVVGVVFRDDTLERRHTIEQEGSRAAEQYRQLRTNLQFLDVDHPPQVIMVSSSVPSEGKTTTTINLAIALADAGRRVTVVEADLRRPKVIEYLQLVGGAGLTNVLAGTADMEEMLQTWGGRNIRVIAAGPPPPSPSELLGSAQMGLLLEKLRADNDYVLVDAAPMLPVADAWGLAAHTDGVLLSVRYGSTRRDQLAEAAEAVDRVGARTLGVLLNMVPRQADLASARGQGYEYGYVSSSRNPR